MSPAPPPAPSRVLVCDKLADQAIRQLRSTDEIEVEIHLGLDPGALAGVVSEFDALIVRSSTRVTAEVIEAATRLRVIGRAGTGVDNIDLRAATRAGVVVLNAPGANSIAAAELTLAHLLALCRNLPQANDELRGGGWERKRFAGVELCGKTLGILGLGRIGREVARRATAFGLELLGHDPHVPRAQAAELGIRWLSLDELLARADFVTLHLPLIEETRHLINAARIGRMRRGARLINCARGGLIDEEALLQALESGHLAGAALDAFEEEPPRDLRLVRHPRVVATPHLGASTQEAQERVGSEIVEKIRGFLLEGRVVDAVNAPRD